jgi:uncharacterized membrane protein
MNTSKTEPDFALSTHRIEALGDGVFAIAMTLLVLEIKVPALHGETVGAELPGALLALWPKFLCYVISFVTLGVYWVAHHLHFYTIKRADRMLLWINILFLMMVGLVPFTTALIGEYVDQRLPVIVYGVNMIVISLALQLHWSYATHNHRLVNPDVSPELIRTVTHVILLGPVIYLVAIGLSYVSTTISIAIYLLVNLIYILPGSVHLHLKHKPTQ